MQLIEPALKRIVSICYAQDCTYLTGKLHP